MNAIARIRIDRGQSPEEFGQAAGVSGNTIRRIEDGHALRAGTLKKLADHLGMSPTELLELIRGSERVAA